jgi:hypothetical protein
VRWGGARAALCVVFVTLAACGDEDGFESGEIEGVETVPIGDYEHVLALVEYDRHPPVGGDHAFSPYLINCGFYEEPVIDTLAVHSLEHGAVWISFSPSLDADQVDIIRQLVVDHEKVIAAPYDGLDDPVVVSAWAAQLRLDSATDERLETFVDTFIDAPTAPEAGSACEGAPSQDEFLADIGATR